MNKNKLQFIAKKITAGIYKLVHKCSKKGRALFVCRPKKRVRAVDLTDLSAVTYTHTYTLSDRQVNKLRETCFNNHTHSYMYAQAFRAYEKLKSQSITS